MGGFLAQLIAEADLGTPHIVAPDVGTSAALFAAAAHPERIAGVIVGTGGAAVPLQLGEPLESWVLDPDLDKYRRMDPRAIVGVAMDTIAAGYPTTFARTTSPATTAIALPSPCVMSAGIPRSCPRLPSCCRRSRPRSPSSNGRHDRVVPLANAEFLDERLPTSRLAIIDAGHFVWEEAPTEYASIILDSIS
jgi:pimeloyl-ACP methyl ester carboxylesterase